ncbi:hypothetical protein P168DRAFT_341276 [Aspergillus campestris IBT 28561]|uniref:Wax synthase domain-containing protein n=1 Tax=Aspergillus campestris (strain IBT 28561) TaxID=1392248 RepID=A0A2I1D775_ASPC2|nr:uncharacterized protein P168DRAFT_341276 [Aspergillus campestris IBT 28561]PKY05717.1 hypothetical protein P168DRAFT_341276 [Aspergillus campestris IBT 28561]
MLAPALSFALLTLQILLATTVLEKTKSRSLYRYTGMLVIILITYAQHSLQNYPRINATWGASLGVTHFIYAVHLASLLFLEKATPKSALGHKPTGANKHSPPQKDHSIAFRLCSSTRGIGTNWQVKNIPPVPGVLHARAPQRATRGFLLRQSAIICWIYCWLRVIHLVWNQYIQGLSQTLFPLEEESALYSLVLERAIVRMFSGFVVLMGGVRASLELAYRIASVLCVGLGVSGAQEWPPMFGSTWEAYTLRKFWGWVYLLVCPIRIGRLQSDVDIYRA